MLVISSEGAYELERDATGAFVERPCRVLRPASPVSAAERRRVPTP